MSVPGAVIPPTVAPSPPTAIAPNDRIATIDILRGLALFGVLMVNLVTEFRISIFEQFVPPGPTESPTDRFLDAFVSYALGMKSFALFSLLFGIGLAIQFDRLARRERPLYWLRRRLLILLGFGLFHLLFIWNGDILTEYALAGLLVLPLIREDKETLAICSLGLFGFYLAMPALHLPIYWPDTETFAHHVEAANRVYGDGGLVQVWRFSLGEMKMIFSLHEFVFPRTLALFLLGASIWRLGGVAKPAAVSARIVNLWAYSHRSWNCVDGRRGDGCLLEYPSARRLDVQPGAHSSGFGLRCVDRRCRGPSLPGKCSENLCATRADVVY